MPRLMVATLALLALAAPRAAGHPDTFAPVVKAQRDKVVHITTHGGPGKQPPRMRPFGSPDAARGLGSGFIIASDGYIVTNQHVIQGAHTIEVVLADERKFEATVVGTDDRTDLALIKIAGRGLPVAVFGDSNELEVGDWVIAIGNPLGLDHTVTAGIISAKGRDIFDDKNLAYGEFLQTDAAINPGNSGGPLFDLKGRVIGVNAAITRQGQGIGFAVPSNLAVAVIAQLRRYGQVRRGWLGVTIGELSAEAMRGQGLPAGTQGILVHDLAAGSPAAAGGVRAGDVLTHFQGERVRRVSLLQKLVALTLPGTRVRVKGLRRGGGNGSWRPLRLTLRLGRNPRNPDEGAASLLGRIGVALEDVTRAQGHRLGAGRDTGVKVKSVAAGSLGEEIGLRPGDLILEADRATVDTTAALERILAKAAKRKSGTRISLLVRRGRKIVYLVIRRAALRR